MLAAIAEKLDFVQLPRVSVVAARVRELIRASVIRAKRCDPINEGGDFGVAVFRFCDGFGFVVGVDHGGEIIGAVFVVIDVSGEIVTAEGFPHFFKGFVTEFLHFVLLSIWRQRDQVASLIHLFDYIISLLGLYCNRGTLKKASLFRLFISHFNA